jgi:hypothetical protein
MAHYLVRIGVGASDADDLHRLTNRLGDLGFWPAGPTKDGSIRRLARGEFWGPSIEPPSIVAGVVKALAGSRKLSVVMNPTSLGNDDGATFDEGPLVTLDPQRLKEVMAAPPMTSEQWKSA